MPILTTSSRCILIIAITLFACGCSSSKSTQKVLDDFDRFVDKTQIDEESASSLAVPDSVNAALLDVGSVENKNRRQASKQNIKRFDVSVNNIPAKVFFVSLVSEAGANVVAHPDIEGSISLELKNVSVQEVLDVVRDIYGYEYLFKSGIYTIYPRKLRTQIFHIDYLDVKRVGVTDTSVLIGNISSGSSSGGSSGSGNNSRDQGENAANLLSEANQGDEQNASSSSQGFTPGARVQTLNATNFWGFLQSSLMKIVGGDNEGRFVMTNPQAGLVVVRALPSELSLVRSFLEKSELSVQRQVILETKILEVRLNEQHESGINWGAIGGQLSLSNTISGDSTIDDVLLNGENVSEVLFSSVLGVTDVTKLIGLLDRQGDVSVLSSPRISTVNNQKAVIRVGSDEFFVTGVSNSTTASASSVTNSPEVELSSFFSGISLDVTPQIAENGEVILHVHPIVSDVKDQLKEFQIGDDNFSLPLALRDVRESDSIVKASSGQVVVLGGLMQEASTGVDTKRSRLGSVPVLNILFKHKTKQLQKTELVILMRPIVVEDDTWGKELKASRSGFSQFSNGP